MRKIIILVFACFLIACSEDDCAEQLEANRRNYEQVLNSPDATEQQKKEAREFYERRNAEACD
ncbi:hypothetical protein MKO06_02675 [Gramella sp. GC03-9]|uniref:Lipoprotein n=1 Tax=Christiangramia oceanisediminis TaxID=2920386 RepID=A0A9X2KVT7_9FLAO|nr:hypothetical protein [Gramella oceanisediminis]MCP9198793.1 hypothetical protein [Gramella oceanisediminis]